MQHHTQSEVLVIIPARGGSKTIPRKNIRLLAGYPLIAYSIAAGLEAGSVCRVIISTLAALRDTYAANGILRRSKVMKPQHNCRMVITICFFDTFRGFQFL